MAWEFSKFSIETACFVCRIPEPKSVRSHTAPVSKAAWYPDTPSSQDQSMMTNFIGALARFYPCSYCAADFQENLKAAPVKYVQLVLNTHCFK